jgi:hypothetical protein
MWAVVAVLLLGAVGVAIYFATQGRSTVPSEAHAGSDEATDPDRPEPEHHEDEPAPAPREPDKWDRSGSARSASSEDDDHDHDHDHDDDDDDDSAARPADIDGEIVEVAQGVRIIAPPGMPVRRERELVMIGNPKTLAIIAAPITEKGNDPDVLVRQHAKQLGLELLDSHVQRIAGAQRKVFQLGGTPKGVEIVQIVVPLLGPGYRVGILLNLVAPQQADPKQIELMNEVLERRILVPSSGGAAPSH